MENSKFKLWQLIAAFGTGIAIVLAVVFVPKVGLQGYTKLDIKAECNGDVKCEINKKLDILLEYFSTYTGTFDSLSIFTQQWTQFVGQWTQFTGQWTKFTGEMKEDIEEAKEAAEEAAENTESSSGSSGGGGSSDSSEPITSSSGGEGSGNSDSSTEKATKNLDNAVDTLVIVNTDDYNIDDGDVKDLFKKADKLWLEAKTTIKFNIIDVKIISFKDEKISSYYEYLDKKYFKESKLNSPEYIVAFYKDGDSDMYGGYSTKYQLAESNNEYCTEFPTIAFNKTSIPGGIIDYKHKFGRCGYDKSGENIISKVSAGGECKNSDGLTCVMKNGYQMCPNLVSSFYAIDPIYFTIDTIVHELLHPYGQNGNLDHYGTEVCNTALGTKKQELEAAGVSAPFNDLFQEYAGICPNVWDNFKNSQKSCKN